MQLKSDAPQERAKGTLSKRVSIAGGGAQGEVAAEATKEMDHPEWVDDPLWFTRCVCCKSTVLCATRVLCFVLCSTRTTRVVYCYIAVLCTTRVLCCAFGGAESAAVRLGSCCCCASG